MNLGKQAWIGNAFMHPLADYLLIGSAWSIVATAVLIAQPSLATGMSTLTFAILVLVVNSAHFAASTVRLYADPNNYNKHPFLTMVLPLLALGVVAICVYMPSTIGKHLQALYLTWSPFHYAAQIYGLSNMYCARAGVRLAQQEKDLVWWVCMLPFFRAFLGAPDSGLGWFVSRETLSAFPGVAILLHFATQALNVLIFVAPCVLMFRIHRVKKQVMPLIVVVMMLANGLWWTALDYLNAFLLATIAHGLQYLAIVLVYHIKDTRADAVGSRRRFVEACKFYGICLVLGYGLFYCWPYAYVWAGAGVAESLLMVAAVINIHHFIVDRYIWRVGPPAKQLTAANVGQPIAS
jgi:hypothetical protein